MKLIAALAWYEEPLPSLATCLEGLHRLGVDHVVALDGAYSLYPDGKPNSHPDQHAVLHGGCRTFGMGSTIVVPQTTWAGNEVEKRTALFRHALAASEPGADFIYVVDADEVIVKAPADLKDRLAATDRDAALINVIDTAARRAKRTDWPDTFVTRRFFRAQPIHLDTNHYTYLAADGRILWQGHNGPREVPALDLTDHVTLEHRPLQRDAARQIAKRAYYTTRDEAGLERGICERCGTRAVLRTPARWTFPGRNAPPVAALVELCASCADRQEKENRRLLRQHGIDPATMRWHERYAPHVRDKETAA